MSDRRSEKRQRTILLAARFTPDEALAVHHAAQHAGTSISALLRTLALAAARETEKTSP